jgi:serine phosphatase RsbU (regulator of sigma subunit)/DNA-binding NarL/FixJ family response regulator
MICGKSSTEENTSSAPQIILYNYAVNEVYAVNAVIAACQMSESKPIRIIIADDQVIVRSGLSALLLAFDDLQLIGQATDGEEAVQLVERVRPDVVLMDIKMPNLDGIAATRLIRSNWPDVQVVMLTSFSDRDSIQSALQAGACGYLLKDTSAEELVQAIREVHHGLKTVAPLASEILVKTDQLELLLDVVHGSTIEESELPGLLDEHVPKIFPNSQVEVRLFPNYKILTHAPGTPIPLPEDSWEWVRTIIKPQAFSPGDPYPWNGEPAIHSQLIMAPILDRFSRRPVGGIGILYRSSLESAYDLMPIVQSLADGIGTAYEKAQTQARRRTQQRVSDELASAGRIQASILPERPPQLGGWDLSARLESARETSGDFYDFIPLENGKLGIVIADVTDKGMGAALFMALSSTLIRTFAAQYPTIPAFAMGAINRRLISDTRGSMFVTTFFGVLDPKTGRMHYVNAGHPPPVLLRDQKGKPIDRLKRTGIALGIMEDAVWQQKLIRFSPGDVLFLFTDGVTEAQDANQNFFGEYPILQTLRANKQRSALEIQEAVLAQLREFMGDARVQDDIAVMVVRKE